MVGKQPRWAHLYKIYEIIRNDIGDDGIRSAGWATKALLSAFTGSVNNPNVMGSSATCRSSNAPPKGAMSLDKAELFLQGLLRKWSLRKYDEAVQAGVLPP